jgi:hypothetical protein
METYLSDTAKKNVMNRPAILRRFVESHQAFMERKVRRDLLPDAFYSAPAERTKSKA